MDAAFPHVVEFTVPGIPVPWARAGSKAGIRFTPAKQRNAMGQIKSLAWQALAGRHPFTGPVELWVTAIWIPPASWPKKRQATAIWRTGRPDADNLGKLIADSLNGIVFVDDAQVVDLRVRKLYGHRAELVVRIEEKRG